MFFILTSVSNVELFVLLKLNFVEALFISDLLELRISELGET
jgi:hypothetical protein